MDQVAIAMENIKQVSAENAAGSRQSEASAHNLNELGQKLRHMSERFKLGNAS
jgi:methyl-accepting chemotaxis protein